MSYQHHPTIQSTVASPSQPERQSDDNLEVMEDGGATKERSHIPKQQQNLDQQQSQIQAMVGTENLNKRRRKGKSFPTP